MQKYDFFLKRQKINTQHPISGSNSNLNTPPPPKINLAASEKVRIFASDFNIEINEAFTLVLCMGT